MFALFMLSIRIGDLCNVAIAGGRGEESPLPDSSNIQFYYLATKIVFWRTDETVAVYYPYLLAV